jgi:hypothetical protein
MTTLATRQPVTRPRVHEEPLINGEPALRPPEEGAIEELDDETILEQDLDNDDLSEDDVDVDLLEESIEELELSESLAEGDDDIESAYAAEFVCQCCALVVRRSPEGDRRERMCRDCSV